MKLTPEIKAKIDEMSYYDLLLYWRRAPGGAPMFQDESGEYWGTVMAQKRSEDESGAVQASKDIGWDR